MVTGGILLASGTRVVSRYVREAQKGVTPAAVTTPTTTVSAVASAGTGLSKFTRATGSFVTDGFIDGQWIKSEGFTTTANNGTWRVSSVTALECIVYDAGSLITDETADVSQTLTILMVTLRATQRNINLEKNILESEEVDADGQETDSRHGFNRVVGSYGYQLSLEDYDDLIEFAFGGAWTAVTTTGSPSMSVNGTTDKFIRATGSFINDGFRPGDIIRTASFSNGANNADWRVLDVSATEITVNDPDNVLVTEGSAGGKSLVMPGMRIDVTPAMWSVTFERAFLDVEKYQVFKGVVVDQMQFNVQPESMIGGSINLPGMSALALASSPLSAEDPVAPSGSSPFAAFDGEIFEGGEINGVVTSMEATLARNRSLEPVVGSRFSPDVFEGTAKSSGTSVFFFQDEVQFNKFINETESTSWIKADDPNSASDFINIVYPRVKYNGANMDPPQEGPVPMEMPFRALKETGLAAPGSTTINTLMTIQRSNS